MYQQWPSEAPLTLLFSLIKSAKYLFHSRKTNLSFIEAYFKKLFNSEVAVMPSGRSAIYYFASCLKMSRTNTVLINKYSSYCMYQSLGAVLNVSTDYSNPDFVVIDHKWGYENLDPRQIQQKIVLEDSCDSYISTSSALFPNGGQVEIVSLSKVLGTLSGAIIIFKDGSLKYQYIENIKVENKFRGRIQFVRKCHRIMFYKFIKAPLENEYHNNYITNIELSMIRCVLDLYTSNFIKQEARIERVNEMLQLKNSKKKRLGPGVVLKISSELSNSPEESFPNGMILRHFDISNSNGSNGHFEKCLYVPTHFKIPDNLFNQYLDFIRLNNNHLNVV